MNTVKKQFRITDELTAVLDVPDPRQSPSIFVVAGHKTGSVLLTNIIADIAAQTSLPSIQVESSVWRQGVSISDWSPELYAFLEEPGYVFYSFRWLQKLPDLAAFEAGRKLFMVRDPRDAAVSYYFSMAKSHTLPKSGKSREKIAELREAAGQMDIDEFVQGGKADPILRNVGRFAAYQGREDSVFYKYEDVIFNKPEWVKKIALDLDVDLSAEACAEIAKKHDIRPEKEDPNAHIRSVTPGGYVNKLSAESIAYIRKTHPIFFEKYGYE